MMFRKYQHVERLGNDEVEGIELGECVIMPKLDGTNASIWLKDDGTLGFGSRTRELSLDKDNASFMALMVNDKRFKKYFEKHPTHRLYGEWLVPHTLKGYDDTAWKKFYVFDVLDNDIEYIPYSTYKPLLEECGIDYIEPLAIVTNPSKLDFYEYLDKNVFLMKEGVGEGIVIHNYGFRNKYGRQTWAKIVRAEFKTLHKSIAKGGQPPATIELVEGQIVDKYITSTLVEKEYAKIVEAENGWSSKYIPRLLTTIYHCLVTEELWNAIKDFKYPTINFKILNQLCITKIKTLKSDLF